MNDIIDGVSMIELIVITILVSALYIAMGISTYKLCKTSSIGSLCLVGMWIIFVWPIMLIVGAFVGDIDD